MSGDRASVVLVHGAWHGAWCWTRVVDALVAAGISTTALDLPGHGADDGPLADLHGDADRVRAHLDSIDGPVVLVGHSYGGAVITEAGVHPAVARLVYVAAFALDEAESCSTAAAQDPATAAISHAGRPSLGDGLRRAAEGSVIVEPAVGAVCFYNDCEPDDVAWALAQLGPHPVAALGQEPRALAWHSRPSTYAICAEDLTVHPDLQRLLAQRCTTSVEWPTGHSPFLSQPQLVVDLLLDEVNAAASATPPAA